MLLGLGSLPRAATGSLRFLVRMLATYYLLGFDVGRKKPVR